jgi:hypothetical protein
MQQIDQVSLKIAGIELIEYSIKQPFEVLPEQFESRYNVNIEHKVDKQSNRIICIMTFEVIAEESSLNLANAKIGCIFDIVDMNQFIENDAIHIPDQLIVTLNSISLSTCRGVMFGLFRGTYLHNTILPIIDPKSFIMAP